MNERKECDLPQRHYRRCKSINGAVTFPCSKLSNPKRLACSSGLRRTLKSKRSRKVFNLCNENPQLNPTEQTCNTVGFRQFIVAYNTYLHKMVILTKYNLVENLGP